MKAIQILDRIEYKPDCHHCYTEDEVIKAMKKYAKEKCKEQAELLKKYIDESKEVKDIPLPEFD